MPSKWDSPNAQYFGSSGELTDWLAQNYPDIQERWYPKPGQLPTDPNARREQEAYDRKYPPPVAGLQDSFPSPPMGGIAGGMRTPSIRQDHPTPYSETPLPSSSPGGQTGDLRHLSDSTSGMGSVLGLMGNTSVPGTNPWVYGGPTAPSSGRSQAPVMGLQSAFPGGAFPEPVNVQAPRKTRESEPEEAKGFTAPAQQDRPKSFTPTGGGTSAVPGMLPSTSVNPKRSGNLY